MLGDNKLKLFQSFRDQMKTVYCLASTFNFSMGDYKVEWVIFIIK